MQNPLLGAGFLALTACGHAGLEAQREALDAWEPRRGAAVPASTARTEEPLRGDVGRWVGHALRRAPRLEAVYGRWQARVAAAPTATRLPEPTLGYGGFVRAVETRVGPQRHRLSLRQSIPWPGRLNAAQDAEVHRAAAAGAAFRAEVLDLARDVAAAYWSLWNVERSHAIRLEHERLLRGLVATVQARVETGQKPVAELMQVQLRLEHLRDHRTRHESEVRQLRARLLETVGADPTAPAEIEARPPAVGLPAEKAHVLRGRLVEHPRVARWSARHAASRARARAARRQAWPSFEVGADYVVTGSARVPGVEDSGKDPVALALGFTLPVWRGAYAAEAAAADAEAAAAHAGHRREALRVSAELEAVIARLEETHERVARYADALIPRAEALYETVVAAYEVGRAGVSEVLLALEDELELRLELADARAHHAIAWADLDRLTLRPEQLEARQAADAGAARSGGTP